MSLWGSARDANKAKSYILRNSEELPIPFPPPIEEALPDPDPTMVSPSTTNSYLKPTVSSTTGAQDGSENEAPGSDGMSDSTRAIISAVGTITFVLMLAAAGWLIVRRVRQNRRDAALREEGRTGEGEEVNMRLLDRGEVIYDEDEEEAGGENREDPRCTTAPLGTNPAAFHSGFLDDEGASDREENESTPLASQR